MKLRSKQMTVEQMTVEQLQNEMADQRSELKTKPTILAAAMQNLSMDSRGSFSEQSQELQQSQELDDNEKGEQQSETVNESYSGLDGFISDSEKASETDETQSEELSEEDAAQMAGFFVGAGSSFVESLFDYPVTIDNETQQAISVKAVPVVKKYADGMQLPPWLVRYREELELLGVIALAGVSIYKQIKVLKVEEAKAEKAKVEAEKAKKSNMQFNPMGEVVTNGS